MPSPADVQSDSFDGGEAPTGLTDKQGERELCATGESGQIVLECDEGERIADVVVQRGATGACDPIRVYSCSYNSPKVQELNNSCLDQQRCSVPAGSAYSSCGHHESVLPDGRGGRGGGYHHQNSPTASTLSIRYRCVADVAPPDDTRDCVSAEEAVLSLPESDFAPGITGEGDNGLCLLCEGGVAGMQRPYYVADELGNSCAQLVLQAAADSQDGVLDDAGCKAQQQAYNALCCGDAPAGGMPNICQLPPPPVDDPGPPSGPYTPCSVCRDGQTPKNSSMVITMLYVGTATCTDMDLYAKDGQIARHLCDPLRYFAEEPCGCE